MNIKVLRLSGVTALVTAVIVALVPATVSLAQDRETETVNESVRIRVRGATAAPDLRDSAISGSASDAAAGRATVSGTVSSSAGERGTVSASRAVTLPRAPVSASVFDASRAPRSVNLATEELALKRGELLVTQTADPIRKVAPARISEADTVRLELPVQAYYVDSQGDLKQSGLVAEIAGGGMRVRGDEPGFSGQVFVALEDKQDPTATYRFDSPAALLVTASVDEVVPAQFDLEGTNDWKPVVLSARNPDDPVPLRIRASIAREGIELALPVIRPTLTLSGDRPAVQGLGLEEMIITVASAGLPNPDGRTVSLASTRGKLGRTALKLGPDGVATTTLRSIGAGPFFVTARSEGFTDATSDQLTFSWPVAFLTAALLGGLVGAAIGHLQETKGSGRRRVPRLLLTGALAGLGAAVLYAVGVNILPTSPTATAGEALVFALALVGGFLGFRIPKPA